MSQRREQGTGRLSSSETVLRWIERWYHVPVLALLLSFMTWIRVRNWESFVVGGRVLFSGNDAWYHYRQVEYTVRNWPGTMPFDPWTNFPVGTSVGQFGTLFDQIIATVALAVGLGSPSEHTISLTLLFAPAAFGVLTAVPVYFIGRRFGGRLGGVVAVSILALSPGDFLTRSLVGFSDHQIAEAFFQAFAVLAVLAVLAVSRREKPVYEQFVERDLEGLRRPVGWGVLAGVALGAYVWAWPPAILLIGILGVYFAISLTIEYVVGASPEHTAIAGALALGVAGVLSLVPLTTLTFSPTAFSLLQPLLAFTVAAGCVFMAWLARAWDARGLPRLGYPAAIVAGIVLIGGLVFVLAPDLAALIRSQFLRVAGFGTSATAQTVGEAQPIPLGQATTYFTYFFGLAYLTAGVSLVVMAWRLVRGVDERRPEFLFILVWTVFIVAATLTQQRFNYYLLLSVTALNAFLVGWIVRLVTSDAETDAGGRSKRKAPKGRRKRSESGTTGTSRLGDLQTYQVLVIAAALLLVTAPLVVRGQYPTASQSAARSATPGEVVGWEGTLAWMAHHTPEEGTYGGANNEMAYYGTYARTTDFNYPRGAYGVLSWWDYGHFITALGRRVPVANPFQQNALEAANFLLATNETHANNLLATDQGGQVTRYVMLDWKLAEPESDKFTAPMVFYDDGPLSERDVLTRLVDPQQPDLNNPIYLLRNQRYYESMRVRLYEFDGSAVSPKPVVVDYSRPGTTSSSSLGTIGYAFPPQDPNASAVRRFDTMSAARAFVRRDGSAQVGGIQGIPSEYVPALEHYRLVHASQKTAQNGDSWVKTFERVPGARVEGTGPPNSRVNASVTMRVATTGRTFTYTQYASTDANGRFSMTLPYSTTGYDAWGTEKGYTDVSVRATGPYTFTVGGDSTATNTTATNTNTTAANTTAANTTTENESAGNASSSDENATSGPTWSANASVPEGAVIGERSAPVSVSLRRTADETNGSQSQVALAAGPNASARTPAPAGAPRARLAGFSTLGQVARDT